MSRLKSYLGIATVVGAVILGIKFGRELEDWSRLLEYQPPATIAKLATTTTMTDTARRLFYVNRPTIEARKSALNLCKSTEHTVVLGCYVPSKGIFLQEVTDSRLQGVMEVTAAHEMLHVAYQRMSLFEQAQIGERLQTVLSKLDNPRILKLVKTYRDQDPKSVNNELHSILGTEVQNLSPELEAHYQQYFRDRSQIVALSERYEGVFTSIKTKAKSLSQQLEIRKLALEQLKTQVKQEAESLESERSNLQAAIIANRQNDYSFRVAAFNSHVRSYNQLVAQLRTQTDAYNQVVMEGKSLASEGKSLFESLENKSTVEPILPVTK